MTSSTSAVLPLTIGTWYYRVRGFDYNLPTNAQYLSWSDTEQLGVAPPTFKVVATAPKRKFKIVGAPPTTRRLTITVKSIADGSVVTDHLPKGLGKGDEVVLTDKLVNVAFQFGLAAGAPVGSDRWTLAFTGPQAADLSGEAVLPGGTVSVSGHLELSGSSGSSAPVVGGTGAFANARGTMRQNRSGSTLVDTFVLTLPLQ
jgi:hypothetical protein